MRGSDYEEPPLARFPLTLVDALGESDRPLTRTETIGSPRAQQSRCARRDGCIARTMRKPDRTKAPAVAALLLSSDLRLLVRHGSDGRAECEVVTVGDHGTVSSPQPAAAERRPRIRGVALH